MHQPTELRRVAELARAGLQHGQWMVLIGESGETCASELEAYFAEVWPEVDSDTQLH